MEDIAADDDLLSDMLLDSLEFDPPISTNKMNQAYRSPRFDTSAVVDLVRKRVIIERDIPKAIEDLCAMSVVKKHLASKTPRQSQAFQTHARRYFEAYLPDSGFEFAVTSRYQRSTAPLASSIPDASAIAESSTAGASKAKGRRSADLAGKAAPIQAGSKADLCVVAVRAFTPGELIPCKGGVKDLTKSEDEALRNEAAATRGKAAQDPYGGVLGQGRDFSIIKSSMRNCSQLLLGPARFVNHDCEPSVQFYRSGTQMMFKVMRPIAVNEEILVGYGEHYFGWENSECLCATCESHGKGAFAKDGIDTLQQKQENAASMGEGDAHDGRRAPSRRIKAGQQSPASSAKTSRSSATPRLDAPEPEYANRRSLSRSSNGIRNSVVISDREMIDPGVASGPRCQCVTCGAPFFAQETWWLPDECKRCERHYRIYKADWPNRIPTEGEYAKLSQQALGKRKSSGQLDGAATPSIHKASTSETNRGAVTCEGNKKRSRPSKGKSESTPAESVASSSSSVDGGTPIRLSPLRLHEPPDAEKRRPPPAKPEQAKVAPSRSKEAETKPDESALREEPATASVQPPQPPPSDSGSDLSDPSTCGRADDVVDPDVRASPTLEEPASGSSSDGEKVAGPKTLGKEAKTDVLAKFWGVEGGEGKRIRKPSQYGPVTLAPTVAASSRRSSSHRRTASATSRSSVVPATAADSEEDEAVAESTSRARSTGSRARKTSATPARAIADSRSSSVSASGRASVPVVPSPNNAKRETPASAGAKLETDQNSADVVMKAPPSPVTPAAGQPEGAPKPPVLATQGTERTSVKNLAAFWSAGVDSGSRTRRQAQREPTLLAVSQSPSSPKRRRDSTSSPASSSSDAKRQRGRPPKGRDSEGASSNPSPERRTNQGNGPGSAMIDSRRVSLTDAPSPLREGPHRPASPLAPAPSRASPQQPKTPVHTNGSSSAASGNSPSWPGVVKRGESASPASSAAGGTAAYHTIPGRKNLRIGRPASASRPLQPSIERSPASSPANGSKPVVASTASGWPRIGGDASEAAGKLCTSSSPPRFGVEAQAPSTPLSATSSTLLPSAPIAAAPASPSTDAASLTEQGLPSSVHPSARPPSRLSHVVKAEEGDENFPVESADAVMTTFTDFSGKAGEERPNHAAVKQEGPGVAFAWGSTAVRVEEGRVPATRDNGALTGEDKLGLQHEVRATHTPEGPEARVSVQLQP